VAIPASDGSYWSEQYRRDRYSFDSQSVRPYFPYEQVEEIVRRELGVRISKAFSEFDQKPVAAGSLGQVQACDCGALASDEEAWRAARRAGLNVDELGRVLPSPAKS